METYVLLKYLVEEAYLHAFGDSPETLCIDFFTGMYPSPSLFRVRAEKGEQVFLVHLYEMYHIAVSPAWKNSQGTLSPPPLYRERTLVSIKGGVEDLARVLREVVPIQ